MLLMQCSKSCCSCGPGFIFSSPGLKLQSCLHSKRLYIYSLSSFQSNEKTSQLMLLPQILPFPLPISSAVLSRAKMMPWGFPHGCLQHKGLIGETWCVPPPCLFSKMSLFIYWQRQESHEHRISALRTTDRRGAAILNLTLPRHSSIFCMAS